MKAIILAGGKGTRMGGISEKIPKPMIKIGGFPMLEHQINLLKRYNIKEIIILTQHLPEVIEKYFKDGKDFGVKIKYFKENNPLGTAGAVKEIERELKKDFIVLYGDIMLDIDIAKVISFHKEKNSSCTIALHPNDHPYDSDLVEVDNDQKVIAFYPKPHKNNEYYRNLVNACFYIFSPKVLEHIKKGRKADFGKDIFPKIFKNFKIYGYNTAEYIKDVGTPQRLKEVKKDYLSGKIGKLNKDNKRKAVFLDRDGTINMQFGGTTTLKSFKLYNFSSKAIKKINKADFLAVVITNQPAVTREIISEKELLSIHKKMETLLGKDGAKLDAIYYCPHTDENNCNCRKPRIELVKKAEKDFNIDLKNSYFIGDSFRDILCGKNAGVKTIRVRTGDGLKDCKEKPDYYFENLYKAVNFIVNKK